MKMHSDVVIAGAGLSGSTLALALSQVGISVTIVDPLAQNNRASGGFDGRGYALALTSQRLLYALGVWPDVADNAQPMLRIKVSDGSMEKGPSPFALEFDHAEIEEGPMGYMLEDRFLRPALLQAISRQKNISIIHDDTVVGQRVVPGGVEVELANGAVINSRLLIGCDGRKSQVAVRAGIQRDGWEYGQTALVCSVDHELPHDGTAHQYFLPAGPLAILPLPGNRSSIVWTETNEAAVAINQLNDASYLKALQPRFGDFRGKISLTGQRFSYPLVLSMAQDFAADRVALVGDAAHTVHPIAGQGLNSGLKDIATIVEVLADAKRRGEDIGRRDVLNRYQLWRRFDAMTLALATDGFNRLFSNDNSILRFGRDLGLAAVNALPGLRRKFVREAAGLSGDVPKLMQGRPI